MNARLHLDMFTLSVKFALPPSPPLGSFFFLVGVIANLMKFFFFLSFFGLSFSSLYELHE